ncbi:MAG: YigZ family protein [Bacilli bacterium]|nr:YigZ family protein [Bacilli bacterium]
MYTIKKNVTTEIIINKSRFIGILMPVDNIEDINNILNNIKNEYKDATHYCYAYIIDNTKRFNDDGEPGGTAGMPILNVIEQNNLNHVLIVVVRYFGGIKLGAGGLVRAYSKISSECIKQAKLAILEDGYLVSIKLNYNNIKDVDNLLKNEKIIDKSFMEDITYKVLITKNNIDLIKNLDYKILKEMQIKSDV